METDAIGSGLGEAGSLIQLFFFLMPVSSGNSLFPSDITRGFFFWAVNYAGGDFGDEDATEIPSIFLNPDSGK